MSWVDEYAKKKDEKEIKVFSYFDKVKLVNKAHRDAFEVRDIEPIARVRHKRNDNL